VNATAEEIPADTYILPDGQTCRILGAFLGNKINYSTPWPSTLEKISSSLTRWDILNPSLEGRRHIINMVIGGRTQFLTRAQSIPDEFEEELLKMESSFLWSAKTAQVSKEMMSLPVKRGGKQILDLTARNEAIDLWLLSRYLTDGPERPHWCYFVDGILSYYLQLR